MKVLGFYVIRSADKHDVYCKGGCWTTEPDSALEVRTIHDVDLSAPIAAVLRCDACAVLLATQDEENDAHD